METVMGISQLIVWVAVVLLLLVILMFISVHILERRDVPNKYEWLKVLNYTEWKSTRQIRKEMEEILKKESLFLIGLYPDLDNLEEEGLVTSREGTQMNIDGDILQMYEYRLTSRGTRKKVEIGSTQKNKHDFQVQPT
jgi:hypothetical protein